MFKREYLIKCFISHLINLFKLTQLFCGIKTENSGRTQQVRPNCGDRNSVKISDP